jgi:hypothetical protein
MIGKVAATTQQQTIVGKLGLTLRILVKAQDLFPAHAKNRRVYRHHHARDPLSATAALFIQGPD